MEIKEALARIVERQDLSTNEMIDVMRQIMTGQCDDAQIGAFLVALRMKSESIDEIAVDIDDSPNFSSPSADPKYRS